MRYYISTLLLTLFYSAAFTQPALHYTLTAPQPSTHYFHVDLQSNGWNRDTLNFQMPNWTPGYYQLLNYANAVENVVAKNDKGKDLSARKLNDNTWQLIGTRKNSFTISYEVRTSMQFVAQSYLDEKHGYAVLGGIFMYPVGYLQMPVAVTVKTNNNWKIATGLEQPRADKPNEFRAANFDILYDCPVLMGDLEELPSFKVKGVDHRFIGYALGKFDRAAFMKKLQKVVEASVDIIGEIPYDRYTFIAIGPGRGGIEHLNNTTFGFEGTGLDEEENSNRMMNFLAHEYFHHYNVKRIRPFELGPFDYNQGSKTNLLWVSEGLSVYYEFLIVRHAGLTNDNGLLANFEKVITQNENNPGRFHQSLVQASFRTWADGPMGTQGDDPTKSISYYDKGPAIGWLLDLAIRQTSQNKKSLDDVMRFLYQQYYKKFQRGFTDAEFQQACETIAGAPLTEVFEYVYTTKDPDYNKYLGYAGINLDIATDVSGKKNFKLTKLEPTTELQNAIFKDWTK
jgi:predicted metalloprotease with PDZ domain